MFKRRIVIPTTNEIKIPLWTAKATGNGICLFRVSVAGLNHLRVSHPDDVEDDRVTLAVAWGR